MAVYAKDVKNKFYEISTQNIRAMIYVFYYVKEYYCMYFLKLSAVY